MARARRGLLMLAMLGAAGCAGHPARRGSAEVRGFYFADDRGLTVATAGASARHAVTEHSGVTAQALVDRIQVHRPQALPPDGTAPADDPSAHHHGHAGHDDVDVVTSASVTVTGGEHLEKLRYELSLGGFYETGSPGAPGKLELSGRYSSEADYQSYSVRVSGSQELLERHLTVTAFAGFGHDSVAPLEAPPGETAAWPASHQRLNGGLTASGVLSARLVLAAGVAGSYQYGRLHSPYRRARVVTTLFPERLPQTRQRLTAFVSLSWYLGFDTALHVRPAAYADSWGVRALIPELSLVHELSPRWLVAVRYRLYSQTPASFYRAVYDDIQPIRTNDIRLAALSEHSPSAEVVFTALPRRSGAGPVDVVGSYRFSALLFPNAFDQVHAHVGSLGVRAEY